METLVASAPWWLAFVLASLVLAATPGPGVLYVVARTLAQGRAVGLVSVAGVALGNLGNALAAALGLAALFALSSAAFTVLKLAGAAYLLHLAWKAWRGGRTAPGPQAFAPPRLGAILREGFLVALLNPKTAIFFAAFLPQFMQPGVAPLLQGALFGAVFVAIAACTDTVYVLAAARLAPALRGLQAPPSIGRWASAAVYAGLAMFTALSNGPPARPPVR